MCPFLVAHLLCYLLVNIKDDKKRRDKVMCLPGLVPSSTCLFDILVR